MPKQKGLSINRIYTECLVLRMIQPVLKALAKTEAETRGRSQILHRLGLGVQQRSSKFDIGGREGERGRERERYDCLYYTWVLAISSFAPFPPLLDPSKPQLRPWHCGPQCYESAGHMNQESYRIALELGLQATQVTRTSAGQDFAGCSGGYEPAWLL